MRRTPTKFARAFLMMEVWEHFKKLSIASDANAVSVRLQCEDATFMEKLNATVPMKHVLDLFLSRSDDVDASIVERGWWKGNFSGTKGWNRLALVEYIEQDGWDLMSVTHTVSEREWLIQGFCFCREKSILRSRLAPGGETTSREFPDASSGLHLSLPH